MDTELNTIILDDANYQWLRQAFGYGASSSVNAASNLLTQYRNYLSAGGRLEIRGGAADLTISSTTEFDQWVYARFPFLAESSDYPRNGTFGELRDLASRCVIDETDGPVSSSKPFRHRNETGGNNSESRCPVDVVLHILSVLNLGTDHEANFRLAALENTGSLQTDVEQYFAKLGGKTDLDWSVETERYDGSWEELVAKSADTWFFRQTFSPKTDSQQSAAIIDAFLHHLRIKTCASTAYRLSVSPPVFYENFWVDIILENDNQRWLLHFGFSD